MIPLTGSIVVLDFARFIPLPSEYDAPGAIGQYNLQVVADVENQHKDTWNSSIMNWWFLQFPVVSCCVKEAAASSYIGMLVKQDVVDTAEEPDFITHSHARQTSRRVVPMAALRNAAHWVHSQICQM
jgi:hypothetical protein